MILYLVIRAGAFLSRIVPRSWRYLIGTVVGDLVFLLWRSKRRVVLQNMATVHGRYPRDPHIRRVAIKSLRNYCKYLIEFLELPVLSTSDAIVASMKIHGLEHLHRALEEGRGVILASAHYGSIELPGLRLKEMTDFHAVYDTFRPAYLDRLIAGKRREKGIDLIPVSDIRSMMTILRGGGTLALLFDKPMDMARGVRVRFFGHETSVPGGPAFLAMRTGATLLPVYTVRQPDKSFESTIYPPVTWTSSGSRETDIRIIMQKLIDTMQTAVRARPDQWYMFRPMWPPLATVSSQASESTSSGSAG